MIDSLSDIVNASLSKNVGYLKSLIVNLGSMMMILVYWLRVGLACVILTLAILIMISQSVIQWVIHGLVHFQAKECWW